MKIFSLKTWTQKKHLMKLKNHLNCWWAQEDDLLFKTLKITDFGLAREFSNTTKVRVRYLPLTMIMFDDLWYLFRLKTLFVCNKIKLRQGASNVL